MILSSRISMLFDLPVWWPLVKFITSCRLVRVILSSPFDRRLVILQRVLCVLCGCKDRIRCGWLSLRLQCKIFVTRKSQVFVIVSLWQLPWGEIGFATMFAEFYICIFGMRQLGGVLSLFCVCVIHVYTTILPVRQKIARCTVVWSIYNLSRLPS